jgi:YD repeat-containing protein
LNHVTSVIAANGATTVYTYDSMGQLNGVTDALGHFTKYIYDQAGNLAQLTDELFVPDAAKQDPKSFEILRVSVANNGQRCGNEEPRTTNPNFLRGLLPIS